MEINGMNVWLCLQDHSCAQRREASWKSTARNGLGNNREEDVLNAVRRHGNQRGQLRGWYFVGWFVLNAVRRHGNQRMSTPVFVPGDFMCSTP